MKTLERDRLVKLLRYDAETGRFTCEEKRGPLNVGDSVGTINKAGYTQIQIDGVIFYAHRLAWLFVYGTWPTGPVDHINGERSDNRIANLRDATASINAQNQRRPRSDNKSGYLGVSLHSDGKWQARIKIGGTYKSLGLHKTKEMARDAYLEAKRKFHQGCTI